MNAITTIHPVDLGIGLVLLAGAAWGLREGIAKQLLRLVSYVISVYVAIALFQPVSQFLEAQIREVTPAIPRVLGAVGTFLATYLLSYFLGLAALKAFNARNVKQAVHKVGLGPLDRLLGAGVGLCAVGLILGGVFLGIAVYGNGRDQEQLQGSALRPVLMNAMDKVLIAIPAHHKAELQQALERLKINAAQTTGQLIGEGVHTVAGKINQLNSGVQAFNRMRK